MDENTWRFAQLMTWLIGIQSTVILAVFGTMWVHFNKRFDKLDERQTRFENNMIEVKTILRMKECCMIQDERHYKKAE